MDKTSIPSSLALFSFEPADSPAIKKLVFLETDDEAFPEFSSIILTISFLE